MVLYPIGSTKACHVCAAVLQAKGIPVIDHPAPEVTHLLLDVPAFSPDGKLRSGEQFEPYLSMLPESVTVIGGNLKHDALQGYRCVNLLDDAFYLAQNAAITADCALKVTAPRIDFTFQNCSVLIIGWGRIGKCLARMLRALGCHVTVAARKERDRAMLTALGYRAVDIPDIPRLLPETQILYNTVPELVLTKPVPKSCFAVELASRDGILGDGVMVARGLPGKYAPDSAGHLMAETIFRKYKEGLL